MRDAPAGAGEGVRDAGKCAAHRNRPSVIAYARMMAVKERSPRKQAGRETATGAPGAVTGGRGAGADPLDPGIIGARVKALREASGLSLRDLAARSGVSAPMLSQVERGETSPTLTVAAGSPRALSCASPSCCDWMRAAR